MPPPRAKKLRTGFITDDVTIGSRPDEVADRKTPGHWEGGLIIGLGRSTVGTLVERTSRFTTLLHLPRKDGYGDAPPVKNGPALSGYGSESVRDALQAAMTPLPEHLRRSVTWDRGGACTSCGVDRRNRDPCVLLRPVQPLAAGNERKHQWIAATILSEGNRSRSIPSK